MICKVSTFYGKYRLLLLTTLLVYFCPTSFAGDIEFTTQPRGQAITWGQDVFLHCSAINVTSGSGLGLQTQWWFNDGPRHQRTSIFTNGTLLIPKVVSEDVGNYTCVIYNDNEVVTSKPAQIIHAFISMFEVSPLDVFAIEGSMVSFDCITGESAPPPIIFWERNDEPFYGGEQFNATYGGYQADSLVKQYSMRLILRARPSLDGNYKCVARNPALQIDVSSIEVLLRTAELDTPPYVMEDLITERVVTPFNHSMIIDCPITGKPHVAFTWYKNSIQIDGNPDFLVLQNGSLHNARAKMEDAGVYSCEGANSLGLAVSPNVTVVIAKLDIDFVESPKDLFTIAGLPAILRCSPPISVPVANVTWYKDNSLLVPRTGEQSVRVVKTYEGNWNVHFEEIQKQDEGEYFCVGTNRHAIPQSRTSRVARIRVGGAPIFIEPPTGLTIEKGKLAKMICYVQGDPFPVVTWLFEDTVLEVSESVSFRQGKQELWIGDIHKGYEGTYTCRAVNRYGAIETRVYVKVLVPPVILEPVGQRTVSVGDTVIIPCQVYSDPPSVITWYKDSSGIAMGGRFTQLQDGLYITSVKQEDSGSYLCRATNMAGTVESEGSLEIQVLPHFVVRPQSQTLTIGKNATLTCVAAGYPNVETSWLFNGTSLFPQDTLLSLDRKTLFLMEVTWLHVGEYTCRAANIEGSAVTTATIQLQIPPKAEAVEGIPLLYQGENLLLKCLLTGIPTPTVEWQLNRQLVQPSMDGRITLPDRTTLSVKYITLTDAGVYTCRATNTAGVSQRDVQVYVLSRPSPPVLYRVETVSANSIALSWSAEQTTPQTPVSNFVIYYRKKLESASQMSRIEVDSSQRQYEIDGLDPASEYIFMLAATNDAGSSEVSNILSAKTYDAGPSEPRNFQVTQVQARSVTVLWEIPAVTNGQMRKYQLVYRERDSSQDFAVMLSTNGSASQSHMIVGLQPYTWYSMEVQGATMETDQVLWGNWSQTLSVKTGQAAPTSSPQEVLAVAMSHDLITVSWELNNMETQFGIGGPCAEDSFDNIFKRNTMSKESIVWAKLPGLPPSLKWPVKVVDLPLVYSKSDNAWRRLKEIETIEEFHINDIEKWRLAAQKCLRKKPATYEAFQNDIQWAIESVEGELEGHGHPSEKDPGEINRWASNEDVVQLKGHVQPYEKDIGQVDRKTSNDDVVQLEGHVQPFEEDPGQVDREASNDDVKTAPKHIFIYLESSDDEFDQCNVETRNEVKHDTTLPHETVRKRKYISSDSNSDSNNDLTRMKMDKLVPLRKRVKVVPQSDNDSDMSDEFPMLSQTKLKYCPEVNSGADNITINERGIAHPALLETTIRASDSLPRVFAKDMRYEHIYISGVMKSKISNSGQNKKSDRVYNSRHPCPYCKETKSNFSHHILAKKHKNEPEVIEINNAKDENERKYLITILCLKAAHNHNMQVLEGKRGELFLFRRLNSTDDLESDSDDQDQGRTFDIRNYGPCPSCFGWVKMKSLLRHNRSCTSAAPEWSNRALQVQSDIIAGRLTSEASENLIKEVFPIMYKDDISKVAKEDNLIVNLGNQWLMRNRGNEIMRKYYTSSMMRLSARLKLACQDLSQTELEMTDYLAPVHFETVLKAVLACCHVEEMEENLKAPSNAVKLGFDIKRMLSAKLSQGIMSGDEVKQKEATDFLRLMDLQWSLRVTRLARGLLVERSFNQQNELPRPSDVKRLFEYLQTEIKGLDLTDASFSNFRNVAILSLARITLHNGRRCHEVQAMRLSSYVARKTGIDEVGVEIRGELTKFERQLLMRQEFVVIRGKTGKGVPVIIPPDVVCALKFLSSANIRISAGIPQENKYVFSNKGVGVFRGYDAIREVTQAPDVGLQMPDLIRSSKMRKYMATMLQALNTTEAERQWVVDHLGHTMNVHQVHYRQTSDVLERVDVAKVLLIQDLGLVAKYKGKKIQDIQIEEIFDDDCDEEASGEEIQTLSDETQDARDVLNIMETNAEECIPQFRHPDEDGSHDSEEEQQTTRKKPEKSSRQKWSEGEVSELQCLFAEDFRTNTLPGQKRIEIVMKKSKENAGDIFKRKRDTIKKKLSNMMIKRRKEMLD